MAVHVDEEELLAAVAEGDRAALRELYERLVGEGSVRPRSRHVRVAVKAAFSS